MKNKNLIYIGIVLFIIVLGKYFLTQLRQDSSNQQINTQMNGYNYGTGQRPNGEPNRNNCLADDCLLVDGLEYPVAELSVEVKEALDEAINDEYKALSVYQTIIAKFGAVRPFSMIKGAEEQHIASLKAIYDKYALDIPENTWLDKITIPVTLQEACQIGVDAEIVNAALYKNELLPAVNNHEDIITVFTNLMNASEQKHLPAFENCN